VWRGLGLTTLGLVAAGTAYATLTPHGRATTKLFRDAGSTLITVRSNPDLIFQNAGSDHVNILLIGRDVNWKSAMVWDPRTKTKRPFHVHDKETQARSDTMIVVSLDKARKTIRMVSFPRDAKVHLAENAEENGVTKLNAAHAYGGPELLKRTLHDELGLTIHRYAVIKFEGFKKLIDQVGGVYVNVEGALKRRNGKLYRGNMDYDDNWGNLHIHLKPGYQLLNGEQAHSYVRFRMDLEGDPGRIRRQQAVMRALAKQIMHAGITQIPGLVQEVRHQFETDLNDEEIAAAAFFAKKIGDPSKIQPLTLFGVYGSKGSLILNKPKNEKLLAYIFGPTFNPNNFLQRSPWARGDEIGGTNNSNPAALAVLRAAGVLKTDQEELHAYGLNVPVQVEPEHESVRESETVDVSSESRSSRRSRLAAMNESASSKTESGEARRSSRRKRERATNRDEETAKPARHSGSSGDLQVESEAPAERRHDDAAPETKSPRSEDSEAAPSSPLPQAESSSGTSGDSSPVPEPE